MRKFITKLGTLGVIAAACACSSADDRGPAPDPATSQQDQIKQVAVWMNTDGTVAKTDETYITREQLEHMKEMMAQKQAAEARGEEFSISIESPCMVDSNWFFTNNACSGSTFLCLIGTGGPYAIPAGYSGSILSFINWLSGSSLASVQNPTAAQCSGHGQDQGCTTVSSSVTYYEWQSSRTCGL